MIYVTKKNESWETKWEVRMTTGSSDYPWGIYSGGNLCWRHKRFTTAAKSVLTGLNYTRWDDVLKRWKPGFLIDGVDFV